jgi:HlyD family secretion protein
VSADVAETDISRIKLGQAVTITADAYPDQTFQGKVSQVAAQATVTSNVTSFKVKVAITDPKKLLHPGMNVDAKFDAGKLDNVLVVPTVAIARQQNGTAVRVLTPDGKAKLVPVTTGTIVNNKTEVRSGLQGNEKVLVSAPAEASGTGTSKQSGNTSGKNGAGGMGGAGMGGPPPF